MGLNEDLLQKNPRESSGSTTSRKYDFQKNVSLFLLLKRHETKVEYVFLFDFHDDLMVLNSATSPTEIDFFQIKSKDSGHWTISDLCKLTSAELSIVSKMYANKLLFPENTRSINFLSNASYKFKKLSNGLETISLSEISAETLAKDDLATCVLAIKGQNKITDEPNFDKIGRFLVTEVNNKDSKTYCTGALADLVTKINPDNSINPSLAYKQIINEIDRKTNCIVRDLNPKNLNELIASKGVSQEMFNEFLNLAGLYKSPETQWQEIQTLLVGDGLGILEVKRFKSAWRTMNIKLISERANAHFVAVTAKIEAAISDAMKNDDLKTASITQVADSIYSTFTSEVFDEYFIKCLIIKKIHEL